jgi:hypothetical protein
MVYKLTTYLIVAFGTTFVPGKNVSSRFLRYELDASGYTRSSARGKPVSSMKKKTVQIHGYYCNNAC